MTVLDRSPARQDLTDFLRRRRARISPLEVGLVAGARRRTPGLRREEVAQLAGVGITWYTWFEQGRDIPVSAHFLENLARALRLDAAEREHLFTLAQHRPPPLGRFSPPAVTPALQNMLESFPNPAYLKTPRWDLVAWNRPMTIMFGDFNEIPVERRNILWLLFTDPKYRRLMVDWEIDVRRAIARFRLDFGRAGDDPMFVALLRDLDQVSPEFRSWWKQHDVDGLGEGVKSFRHSRLGEIEFEHGTFTADNNSNLRLVVYTPTDAESARKARQLFARKP
jgi:transcriptional regulator with XRE-family HTH domain